MDYKAFEVPFTAVFGHENAAHPGLVSTLLLARGLQAAGCPLGDVEIP